MYAFLEIALGAVIAILITIWVESLRKPKLELRIAEPSDQVYENRPATNARFLGVNIINKPMLRGTKWMLREAALHCHGTITFYNLDGQRYYGRSMPIRWSGSPEPVGIPIQVGDTQLLILDPARITLHSIIDVYPGESERLDVATKFDEEIDCFGWNNEAYFSEPVWRNNNWRLPAGRYLVKIEVVSSGQKCTGVFRLINNVSRPDFRLENAFKTDVLHE
jgi:hypothetical protein